MRDKKEETASVLLFLGYLGQFMVFQFHSLTSKFQDFTFI